MKLIGWRDTWRQMRFVEDRITGTGAGSSDEITWIIGSELDYAAHVELGTYKMEAQPYLRTAARAVARNPGRHVGSARTLESFVRQVAEAIETLAKEEAPVDTGDLEDSIEAVRVK